jgi:hypothetical protein
MIWIFTPEIAAPEGSRVLPISAPVEGDCAQRWLAARVDSAIVITRAEKPRRPKPLVSRTQPHKSPGNALGDVR